MESIHTQDSSATRTLTKTVVDFFLSVKSGLKTPLGSPGKKRRKDHAEAPSPTFRSFTPDRKAMRKYSQGSKKKKRRNNVDSDKQSIQSQQQSQDNAQGQTLGKARITYEEMVKQRIGVEGPGDTYKIPGVKSNCHSHDDTSSTCETVSSRYSRSISTSERQEYSIKTGNEIQLESESLSMRDLKVVIQASTSWNPSLEWPGKSLGFRALTTDKFKSKYRALEKEVCNYQMDSKEIQEYLIENCQRIIDKNREIDEFLRYTHIYSFMLDPIESDMNNLEKLLDFEEPTLSAVRIEILEEKYLDIRQAYENLPEFINTMWRKKTEAESNLYMISQFCVLLENHQSHVEKISEGFKGLQAQYGPYEYLMREYVWPLGHHFDSLKRGFWEPYWLRLIEKFRLALNNANNNNYEAHKMMNKIVSRRNNAIRSMNYIETRVRNLLIDLVRLQE
ncbi:hypothetical protein JCM33374_g3615 [Metschnikowia sp. JCM 33374]|nr:hypothetical protein JCM33374_g3615 [Metschnikowia sp. JCM 33374]